MYNYDLFYVYQILAISWPNVEFAGFQETLWDYIPISCQCLSRLSELE